MNASEVFEQEWAMYGQRGVERGGIWSRRGNDELGAAPFDGCVRPGEIRIFADMERPFLALVVKSQGMAGWTIVPLSPFTVPASSREMLVGERVLQLWNACVAAKGFVKRSWIVDSIDDADLADVKTRMATVTAGRIVAGNGPVAEYERTFLVTGGTFEPLAERKAKRRAGVALWRWGAWGIAAMLMICFAVRGVFDDDEEPQVQTAQPSPPNETLIRPKEVPQEEVVTKELPINVVSESESIRKTVKNVEQEEGVAKGLPMNVVSEPESTREAVKNEDEMRKRAEEKAMRQTERIERIRRLGDQMVVKKKEWRLLPQPTPRTARKTLSDAEIQKLVTCRGAYKSHGSTSSVPPLPCCAPVAESWTDHGTERYAEVSENEFHDPKSEPLSTFSLDVDTSSYALMRRYLMEQKRLPPKTSVRLEEYVNYFRYSYPQPAGGDPVAVDCEMAECPWNKSHKLLRLGVQAKRIGSDKLPPCNLTFLVDKSGSMGGNGGMDLLKSGLNMLVDKLRDEDRVAIVTYASGTEVLLGSTPGSTKNRLHDAINSLEAGGCTYGAGGLQLAYEVAMRNFDKSANNRVILVTDGDFNVGISSPKELEDFIAAKRKSGIFLSVFGVGRGNYQDANMKKLANAGNGNYAYLDSIFEAKKVMMTEFGGTLFTVAKDVKVQVEFNPAQVAGYRLLGYENRMLKAKDFNDDKKDAGEIGSGHSMTAFYEIVPSGVGKPVAPLDSLKYQKRTEVASDEMFTLKLRWKAPGGDKSKRKDIAWRAADITRSVPSEDFRFASAVAEFALVLGDSKFKGNASIEKAIGRARNAKGADAEGYRAEFIRLAELAEMQKHYPSDCRPAENYNVGASEEQLCFALIKQAFESKWDEPPWTDTLKPISIRVWFGNGGNVLRYKLVSSSGDRSVDATITSAASRVGSVRGLTAGFIEKYGKNGVVIQFAVRPK